MTMSAFERMGAGLPSRSDEVVDARRRLAVDLVDRLNLTPHAQRDERQAILKELLGHLGEGVVIRSTFRCDYGSLISVGDGSFVNFDCVFLDAAKITLGKNCWIGPRSQLLTVTHSFDPQQRSQYWSVHRPVVLEDDVWLGAGVLVLPGVTIGRGTIVGAGSIVTRDLPPGVLAFGHPAKIQRVLTPEDRLELPQE